MSRAQTVVRVRRLHGKASCWRCYEDGCRGYAKFEVGVWKYGSVTSGPSPPAVAVAVHVPALGRAALSSGGDGRPMRTHRRARLPEPGVMHQYGKAGVRRDPTAN